MANETALVSPAPAHPSPPLSCNASTCDECVTSADDGVIYGRGCQWCVDDAHNPVCYNFYAPGGERFCTRYVLLNQCERYTLERGNAHLHDPTPGWIIAVIALAVVALAVFAAVLFRVCAARRATSADGSDRKARRTSRSGRSSRHGSRRSSSRHGSRSSTPRRARESDVEGEAPDGSARPRGGGEMEAPARGRRAPPRFSCVGCFPLWPGTMLDVMLDPDPHDQFSGRSAGVSDSAFLEYPRATVASGGGEDGMHAREMLVYSDSIYDGRRADDDGPLDDDGPPRMSSRRGSKQSSSIMSHAASNLHI